MMKWGVTNEGGKEGRRRGDVVTKGATRRNVGEYLTSLESDGFEQNRKKNDRIRTNGPGHGRVDPGKRNRFQGPKVGCRANGQNCHAKEVGCHANDGFSPQRATMTRASIMMGPKDGAKIDQLHYVHQK